MVDVPSAGISGATTGTVELTPLASNTFVMIELTLPANVAYVVNNQYEDMVLKLILTSCRALARGTSTTSASFRNVPGSGPCSTPADACAPGWHACAESGSVADLTQISRQECDGAADGRFVAAASHCATQNSCSFAEDGLGCFSNGYCSQPVCCGLDCGGGGCSFGVWRDGTRVAPGSEGCAAIQSSGALGVLCCW